MEREMLETKIMRLAKRVNQLETDNRKLSVNLQKLIHLLEENKALNAELKSELSSLNKKYNAAAKELLKAKKNGMDSTDSSNNDSA